MSPIKIIKLNAMKTMNREIRFRAWKKSSGKMLDVGAIEFFNDGSINVNHEEPDCILMQFTGLSDKNGKEIYEGDIVRIHNTENDDGMGENYNYTTIEFEKGAFKVVYDFGDYGVTAIGWAIDIWNDMNTTCEVIGNIYENPLLLNPDSEF